MAARLCYDVLVVSTPMNALGSIVRLQVQRSTLKLAAAPGAVYPQSYHPSALLQVPELLLTPTGAIGLLEGGAHVVDVHNVRHAASKNSGRRNDLSIGFTAHYAAMRDRFGEHLTDGIAGENMLVASDSEVSLEQVANGLVIETRDGHRVPLQRIVVAEPCVPFTRFSLRLREFDASDEHVTESLRFLRDGRRGFYASYAGTGVVLRPGDRVFARSPGEV